MRIVLIKDVEKLGTIGEIKEVKDGFARNWLIPQKLAVKFGDPQAKKIIEQALAEKNKTEQELEKLKKLAEDLAGKTVIIKAKVGPTGKLFGAITADDVAKEISTKEVKISSKQVETEPIKTLGEHEITLRISKDIKSVIKLAIEPITAKAQKVSAKAQKSYDI